MDKYYVVQRMTLIVEGTDLALFRDDSIFKDQCFNKSFSDVIIIK